MAVTATVGLVITLSGDVTGPVTVPSASNVASPAQRQLLTTVIGHNPLTIPAGTKWVLVVPPAGSTFVKTLKGVNGDTGVEVDNVNPGLIPVVAGSTTLVIDSTGVEILEVWFL